MEDTQLLKKLVKKVLVEMEKEKRDKAKEETLMKEQKKKQQLESDIVNYKVSKNDIDGLISVFTSIRWDEPISVFDEYLKRKENDIVQQLQQLQNEYNKKVVEMVKKTFPNIKVSKNHEKFLK